MSQRLTVAERRGFARYARELGSYHLPTVKADRGPEKYLSTPAEPALGSLAERLDIIIRRQGGKTGPVRLSAAERAELARYQSQYVEQELAA